MNLLVIFGGKSVEHDISILSAKQISYFLDSKEYKVFYLYLEKNNEMYLVRDLEHLDKKRTKARFDRRGIETYKYIHIDIALPLVHGFNLEDGLIFSLLEFYEIPFVGPAHNEASISFDKASMKNALSNLKIPTLPYQILTSYEDIKKIEIPFPIIAKPCHLGSSIGIEIIEKKEEIEKIKKCFLYDNKIIIEPLLSNFKEYNMAIMGSYKEQETSNIEEVKIIDKIYSFDQKYIEPNKRIILTKKNALFHKLNEITVKIFQSFQLCGIVRIDYLFYDDEIYVNEINLIPGSLSYYLFDLDPSIFIQKILSYGYKSYYERLQRHYIFSNDRIGKKLSMKK